MSDIPAKRQRVPGSGPARPADVPHVDSDEAGRWDLSFRPWRNAFVPAIAPPALGIAWAELPVRGATFMIDLLIIQLVCNMIGQVFQAVLSNTIFRQGGGITDQVLLGWGEAFLPFIVIGIVLAGTFVYFWRVFRASPGQMVLGQFTLRDRDGLSLSKRRAFMRWLLLYMPAWLIFTSSSAAAWLHYDISSGIDTTGAQEMLVAGPVIWFAFLMFTIGLSKTGRGLHDKVAGSVVVRPEGAA